MGSGGGLQDTSHERTIHRCIRQPPHSPPTVPAIRPASHRSRAEAPTAGQPEHHHPPADRKTPERGGSIALRVASAHVAARSSEHIFLAAAVNRRSAQVFQFSSGQHTHSTRERAHTSALVLCPNTPSPHISHPHTHTHTRIRARLLTHKVRRIAATNSDFNSDFAALGIQTQIEQGSHVAERRGRRVPCRIPPPPVPPSHGTGESRSIHTLYNFRRCAL